MSELDADTKRLLVGALELHPFLLDAIGLWESGAPDPYEDVMTLSLAPGTPRTFTEEE